MKFIFIVCFYFTFFTCLCQNDSQEEEQAVSHTKMDTLLQYLTKEVVYDKKRYLVYNNWVSGGVGFSYNSNWYNEHTDERNIGVDLNFNIRKYYYSAGVFASGRDLAKINNYSFFALTGLRKELLKSNWSIFVGPSLSYFRRPLLDTNIMDKSTVRFSLFNRVGLYAKCEVVVKLKYDIGLGLQVFANYNDVQFIYGVRFLLYLSSAFRGNVAIRKNAAE